MWQLILSRVNGPNKVISEDIKISMEESVEMINSRNHAVEV